MEKIAVQRKHSIDAVIIVSVTPSWTNEELGLLKPRDEIPKIV
jgi:hypothetical protein